MLKIIKRIYTLSGISSIVDTISDALKGISEAWDDADTKLFSAEGYRDLNDDEAYKEIERRRKERRNGK